MTSSGRRALVPDAALTVIAPRPGWRAIDLGEFRGYRDLFYFLIWRDIKARYAQTILGVGWAVINPVVSMVVFTIVFGNLAGISSDGVPYAIFSFTALVPWTYFSGALTDATNSLVAAGSLLGKVYLPRLIIPVAPILGKLVDFGISLILLAGLMAWFGIAPTLWVLSLPVLILLMILTAGGLGMWLSSLAIQYRDVKFALAYVIQLLMYAAPVVYPTSLIPERYQLLYALNPMVGVIEGFRAALLATRPMPWDFILVGAVSALLVAAAGAMYFRRTERIFADVL